MSSETTVSNPTHVARYDDMNYPGNRFDLRDHPIYYEVTYWGVARQHDKYKALERAVSAGIEHVLQTEEPASALSSLARDLKHWMTQPGGFTRIHMPWKIVVPARLYRMFVYVLRAQDTEAGNAAYTSIRRYGSWV